MYRNFKGASTFTSETCMVWCLPNNGFFFSISFHSISQTAARSRQTWTIWKLPSEMKIMVTMKNKSQSCYVSMRWEMSMILSMIDSRKNRYEWRVLYTCIENHWTPKKRMQNFWCIIIFSIVNFEVTVFSQTFVSIRLLLFCNDHNPNLYIKL